MTKTNKVEQNKKAWSLLAEGHYSHYRKLLVEGEYELNSIVKRELGDISGKKLLHLQCNTGADSILLARMGAEATGVDLVPENVHFAGRLAQELGVDDVSFVISDIMHLMDTHEGKYNIVFTSDGVIGGYASETKECKNFYWMYTIGGLVNSLARAGLTIEYFNGHDRCAQGMGEGVSDEESLYYYPALPLTFSLKARVLSITQLNSFVIVRQSVS